MASATDKQLHVAPDSPEWHALRKKACSDLWFLNRMLGHETLLPMREHVHYPMIRFAEKKTGIPEIDDARVQMVLVTRSLGKSSCITKARTLQRILRNPDYSVMIGNESTRVAKAFLSEIKNIFERNEFVRMFFPEIIPSNWHDTQWAADAIAVNRKSHRKEPTIFAAGVDTTTTGFHFDEIVVDDMISREAAENARSGSFTEIEQINRWLDTLEPLMSRADSPLTICGTRWWVNDSYDRAKAIWGGPDENDQEFEWICELPSGGTVRLTLVLNGEMAIYKRSVIENGDTIYPERWPMEKLAKMQDPASGDPVFFAANILLEPVSDVNRSFKDEWKRYYDFQTPYQVRFRKQDGTLAFWLVREMDILMSVDPAIKKKPTADRTGIIVSGTCDGLHHILLEAKAERVGVLETVDLIEKLAKQYKPRRIYVEKVAYQEALVQLLFAKGLPVEPSEGSDQSKHIRISALEPFFKLGQVYFHRSQIDLQTEYTLYPQPKAKDDLLDAMAYLSNEWGRQGAVKSGPVAKQRQAQDAKAIERIKTALSYRRHGR